MNDSTASAERVSSRASGGADQYAITYGLGEEMVVDIYINDGEVGLTAAVKKQLIHGMEIWGYLDGGDPAGYVQGGFLLWRQRKEAQPLVGVGGGGGHELAVDVLAVFVKDADLEAMTKQDLGSPCVGCAAASIDTSPGIPEVGKLPLPQETKGAHTEGEDGRHAGLQREETGGTKDGPISTKSRDKIDFVGELGGRVTTGGGVDGEGKVVVDTGGDATFEDNVDVGIMIVQMLCKAHGILDDLGSMELRNEQDVPGMVVPMESEEAYRGLMVQRCDPVRERGDVKNLAQAGRRREAAQEAAPR